MSSEFISSLPYVLLATGAGLLGGLIALFWNPNTHIRSVIQQSADDLGIEGTDPAYGKGRINVAAAFGL